MPSIVLPTPAQNIWPRIQPILEGIAGFLDSSTVDLFSLGGGTVLAALWKHRQSTDIDMLARKGSNVRELLENDYYSDFVNQCISSGASEVLFIPGTKTVTLQFPEGTWDLTEAEPFIKDEETPAEVGGLTVNVLSISQILSGKLIGRGFNRPPRDVFDIAVCSMLDPRSLDAALQRFEKSNMSMEMLIEDIRVSSPKYRLEAPAKIIAPDSQWEKLLSSAPTVMADYIEKFMVGRHRLKGKDDLPPEN